MPRHVKVDDSIGNGSTVTSQDSGSRPSGHVPSGLLLLDTMLFGHVLARDKKEDATEQIRPANAVTQHILRKRAHQSDTSRGAPIASCSKQDIHQTQSVHSDS